MAVTISIIKHARIKYPDSSLPLLIPWLTCHDHDGVFPFAANVACTLFKFRILGAAECRICGWRATCTWCPHPWRLSVGNLPRTNIPGRTCPRGVGAGRGWGSTLRRWALSAVGGRWPERWPCYCWPSWPQPCTRPGSAGGGSRDCPGQWWSCL